MVTSTGHKVKKVTGYSVSTKSLLSGKQWRARWFFLYCVKHLAWSSFLPQTAHSKGKPSDTLTHRSLVPSTPVTSSATLLPSLVKSDPSSYSWQQHHLWNSISGIPSVPTFSSFQLSYHTVPCLITVSVFSYTVPFSSHKFSCIFYLAIKWPITSKSLCLFLGIPTQKISSFIFSA